MKKLQEIIAVVARRRLKKIEVFNEGRGDLNRKSLYYKLYKGVKEGRFRSDEEAAQALFGTDPSDKKYLMLKSRVKARLLNNMFFLENNKSVYLQAQYRTNRDFFAAKFLVIYGARMSGYSLLKSTLKEAQKFEFTDIAFECLQMLRSLSVWMGEVRQFDHFNTEMERMRKIRKLENLADEYHLRVFIPFLKSSSPKPELAPWVLEFIEDLDKKRKVHTSFSVELNYFRLRTIYHEILQEYNEVVKVCDEANAYFHNLPFPVLSMRFAEFYGKQMVGYMHLHDYINAEKNASVALKLISEGSINWMIFNEYYFLLAMHTGNYEKALQIYQQVVKNAKFPNLDPIRREKWKIFEAFLRYMLTEMNQKSAEHSFLDTKFNLFKFLNEVPTFSKDKRGLNIAILILQILFLLDRKDFDGIISRTEALKVYSSRYLRRDENYRSNCFLKMLLTMEKKDFHYENTRKITEKYLVKLQSARFTYRGNLDGLEIIPYEQLWQTILTKLSRLSSS